jgi:hypothetical protein
VTGLANFLLARIDEDDEAARRAADECARHDRDFEVEDPDWQRWSRPAASVASTGPIAEFINRQDPQRVLAKCAADRQIVLGCTRQLDNWVTVRPGVRENRPIREPWTEDDTAADVLTYLALPYADHPDFREEWRL